MDGLSVIRQAVDQSAEQLGKMGRLICEHIARLDEMIRLQAELIKELEAQLAAKQ